MLIEEVKESGKREVRMEEGCGEDRDLQAREKKESQDKTLERLSKVLVARGGLCC